MGRDHFREVFMPQEKIPWFVWYIAFRRHVNVFQNEFVDEVDALKSGIPPKKKHWFFFGLF